MNIIKKNIFVLLFIMAAGLLFSHPHVFIEFNSEFVFEDGKLKGILVKWNLDKLSSFAVFSGYDTNGNRKLDKTEFLELKTSNYNSMKQSKFYAHLTIDEKPIKLTKFEDFKIKLTKNQLLKYTFFIPYEKTFDKDPSKLKFTFYDRSFYIAFSSKQAEVKYNEDEKLTITRANVKDGAEFQLAVSKK